MSVVRRAIGAGPVRRLLAVVIAAAATLTVTTNAAARAADHSSSTRPATYIVSRAPGVLPEGIGLGPHHSFYVSSSGTGAIYRGDLRHRNMTLFVPGGAGPRATAAGVHTDHHGRVFVARPTELDVYDGRGRLVAHRRAPNGSVGAPSLNDFVFTRHAVYVTDFANPVVLRASLDHGRIGPLRPWVDVSGVEPQLPPQFWFLNGIVLSHDGNTLLVSSQGLDQLVRIDIAHRVASTVDLGGSSFAADGMELTGTTINAVLNHDPPAGQGVYRATLSADLTRGTVRVVSTTGFDSPTTLARAGRRLLVVNSQFDHRPGTPPFTVSTLRLR